MKAPGLIIVLCLLALSATGPASTRAAEPSPYGDRLTVDLSANPGILYSNQVFQLTLQVHSIDLSFDPSISYNGLFENGKIIRMSEFKEMLPERKLHGNRLRETRRFVCTARATAIGLIELAPTANVTVYERRASFFGPARFERPVVVIAQPLALTIHPIPLAGRPPSYSGAIGLLAFDVKVEPLEVAVNDLIKIRMSISGNADLSGVPPPAIEFGPHFKVYPPTPIPGLPSITKAFEQTVVPLSHRATEIPAVSFSCFDPLASVYRTTTCGPFPIRFHERKTPVDDGSSKPSVTILTQETSPTPTIGNTGDRWISRLNRLAHALDDGTFLKPVMALPRPVRARLAPAATALGMFDIPAGATVHVLERQPEWTKISFQRNRGWIPSSALQPPPPPPGN